MTKDASPLSATDENSPPYAAVGLGQHDIDALLAARHWDPCAVLGPHLLNGQCVIRAMLPHAHSVDVLAADADTVLGRLERIHPDGIFAAVVAFPEQAVAAYTQTGLPPAYRLRIDWGQAVQIVADPYAFGTVLHDDDLRRLSEGDPGAVEICLGARIVTVGETSGVLFAVWAPNAQRVSVVGEFNTWDGRRHPMRKRHYAGVWELFIPGLSAGTRYKFELVGANGDVLPLKADPVARQTERPPLTASVVAADSDLHHTGITWTDDAWMAGRAEKQNVRAPMSIYEVHAESWMRILEEQGRALNWEEFSERLIPYVRSLGFTHIEFLPLAEHPFGGSWGYQPLGQFAPSARFGTPAQFAQFVDRAHAAGLGIIVDWVPAHFPNDAHGLVSFDGTPLYEHADSREGYHPDWNTMIYNLGRNEVSAFMIASALSWLKRFHIDGLRVDAVASMLYRDYSRKAGEWVPNEHGGRENYESIRFLRRLNYEVHTQVPGAVTIAEESTAWPGVSAPTEHGGLGFDFKWNMGWMHDTLHFMQLDAIYRQHHHGEMTFAMVYAYSEHFVLPLSHDEVVHGKGSLISRMPGDRWQQFANLRACLAFMWAHPGKKLLFMGGELGQYAEWNHDQSPHWHLLEDPQHAGIQRVVTDLNHLYKQEPALYAGDSDPSGFFWLVGDDAVNSVFAFARRDGDRMVIVISNLTPVPRENYRIGLPHGGYWREVLNTDAAMYGGANIGNGGGVDAAEVPSHGQSWSASLTLPPLATLILSAQ